VFAGDGLEPGGLPSEGVSGAVQVYSFGEGGDEGIGHVSDDGEPPERSRAGHFVFPALGGGHGEEFVQLAHEAAFFGGTDGARWDFPNGARLISIGPG